jgi:integrase
MTLVGSGARDSLLAWSACDLLRAGASRHDNGVVFATTIGTRLDAQNIVDCHFNPLLRRAGLPGIRWHDLRRTYTTLPPARGTHATYV